MLYFIAKLEQVLSTPKAFWWLTRITFGANLLFKSLVVLSSEET